MNQSSPTAALSPTRGRILFAVLLGVFLSVLDQTIVATALPTIASDLQGAGLYTWVTTAYLLAGTVSIPFYGKLSDHYGRKPLLILGIGIFLAGSVLSGVAGSIEQLIAFRALQGLGAGSLFPVALAVIGDHYAPAERARPQALFGAVFALAAVIGPTLGGALTESGGWSWVFFINVPVGLFAIALIARSLPARPSSTSRPQFDVAGAVALSVAVSLLLLGLTNKQSADWTDPSVGGLLVGALVVASVFLAVERRAAEPILPLSLFRDRTFAASMAASFFVAIGFYGAVVFLPLWFQTVQGAAPTDAGIRSLALLVGLVVGALAAGRIVARTGRYRILLVGSTAVTVAGFVLLARLEPDTPMPVLAIWMFITGLGLGPTFSVFTVVAQSAAPREAMGVASSTLTFVRQIGGAVGLAVLGTAYVETVAGRMPDVLAARGVPAPARDALAGVDLNALTQVGGEIGSAILAALPPGSRDTVQPLIADAVAGVQLALTHGAVATFVGAAVAVILAAASTLALREMPLRGAVPASGRTFQAAAAAEGGLE